MNKPNRTRNKAVTFRMNEAEYKDLQLKVNESGLTQQAYIIDAIQGVTITPSNEIVILKDISKTFAELENQIRGLATNVNQMAHVANSKGYVTNQKDLEQLSGQINKYRKESENIWQSIRSLIGKHRPTVQ